MAENETNAPATPAAPAPGTEPEVAATASEELGEGGKAALVAERAQRAAAEKREKDLEARIKEFEDRDKTETQKLADRVAELQAEADTAKADAAAARAAVEHTRVVAEVAKAKGVSGELLRGATQEELEAHADSILAFKHGPNKPGWVPSSGSGGENGSAGGLSAGRELARKK